MTQESPQQTVYEIAAKYPDVPGIKKALEWAAYRTTVDRIWSFGKFSGQFKDYFCMMADSQKPIEDISADVLWMCFMNMGQDKIEDKEAVRLFMGPIIEGLKQKMETGNIQPLAGQDLIGLYNFANGLSKSAEWLDEDLKKACRELGSATIKKMACSY